MYALIYGNWIQTGGDIDGEGVEGDHSGHSVAMSSDGSRIVVGAPYNTDENRYTSLLSQWR